MILPNNAVCNLEICLEKKIEIKLKLNSRVYIESRCYSSTQGWCNNIAWNVGPLIWKQFQLSLSSYEYNKVESYKSIVPIMHLSWNLARNIRVTDLQLFELIKRTLLRTLKQCLLIINLVQNLGKTLHYQAYLETEAAPYCSSCEVRNLWQTHWYKIFCHHGHSFNSSAFISVMKCKDDNFSWQGCLERVMHDFIFVPCTRWCTIAQGCNHE